MNIDFTKHSSLSSTQTVNIFRAVGRVFSEEYDQLKSKCLKKSTLQGLRGKCPRRSSYTEASSEQSLTHADSLQIAFSISTKHLINASNLKDKLQNFFKAKSRGKKEPWIFKKKLYLILSEGEHTDCIPEMRKGYYFLKETRKKTLGN